MNSPTDLQLDKISCAIPYAVIPTLDLIKDRFFDGIYLTPDIFVNKKIKGTGVGGLAVVAHSILSELEENFERHQKSMLAFGFYCPYGYVRQRYVDGKVENWYEKDKNPQATIDTGYRAKIKINGDECLVALRMPCDADRKHTAIGLLTTDIDGNPEWMRLITRTMYGEGHATEYFSQEEPKRPWHDINWMRMLQAMILGMAPYIIVKELGIKYDYVHLNDTHSALFLVRTYGEKRAEGMGHDEALHSCWRKARFTCHTLCEQANRTYPICDIAKIGQNYPGFDEETLRLLAGDQTYFRMVQVVLKLVGPYHANCVSKDHAILAEQVFGGYKFFPITNGVHVSDTENSYVHPALRGIVKAKEIPEAKAEMKRLILAELMKRAREAGWKGTPIQLIPFLESVFIVWARRVQDYKRKGLICHPSQFGLFEGLLKNGFISFGHGGLTHGDDKVMLEEWNRQLHLLARLPLTIPIFNYDFELIQQLLKAAAQIWLNNPWYGWEACGTSFMSAMLNFALVLTMADGGALEAEHVVTFGSTKGGDFWPQFDSDARDLMIALVPQIIKLRENDEATLEFLLEARNEAAEKFSSRTMVDKYCELLWVP
jgi:starch phosphorylase